MTLSEDLHNAALYELGLTDTCRIKTFNVEVSGGSDSPLH